MVPSIQKCFVADETDLVDPEPLGRGQHQSHVFVADQPVWMQVQLRLHSLGGTRSFWSSVAMSATASPFHRMLPSKSTSMVTTSGKTIAGGGVPGGMSSFTAWVWMGMVMISMIRSTSITSISGVVLISTTTSGSAGPFRL